MVSNCGCPTEWHHCYSGTSDLWQAESYAHPAKMSTTLCFRILEHLEQLGLLKQGGIVLDPMSGIGTTNLAAGAKGYKSISVELEPKFIEFQQKNKEYAERRLYRKLDWEIIQGDSRKLSKILNERGLVSLLSPPYEDITIKDGQRLASNPDIHWKEWDRGTGYGTTPGQVGNLPDKPVSMMSPPYQAGIGDYKNKREAFVAWIKNELETKGYIEWQEKRYTEAEWRKMNYGRLDGRVMVGSPKMGTEGYNPESGNNIGNLPDKPLTITSPPYEGMLHGQDHNNPSQAMIDHKKLPQQYSDDIKDLNQIGNARNETYLSAMKQIYKEIALVSDVLVVVVKNPTRNGRLRRLDLGTIRIMEEAGWKIHCQHRALLFEETEHPTLFGDTQKKVKGRMSFFKRLAYQKGSPVARWEDVIIGIR